LICPPVYGREDKKALAALRMCTCGGEGHEKAGLEVTRARLCSGRLMDFHSSKTSASSLFFIIPLQRYPFPIPELLK